MTHTARMGQTIGAIARVETARYYERIGLLPRPLRAADGERTAAELAASQAG